MSRLKPEILSDIKSRNQGFQRDNFSEIPKRLNLSYKRSFIKVGFDFFKFLIIGLAAVSLVFGSVTAPTISIFAANNEVDSDAERQALEEELKRLEGQIDEYESQITTYQKQGKTLKSEISNLDNNVKKINLQIKAIKLNLSQLDKKIEDTEFQIDTTKNDIDSNKKSLSSILLNIYQNEHSSLMEILLKSSKISDFFNDLNDLTLLQNNLQGTIHKIIDLQASLEDQKDQLALARADQATLHTYQESKKVETEKIKVQKNDLLGVTKNQESKYQVLLTETKKTAAEIRSRIFKFLGGGEMSFGDAYKFAKLASDSTGVDAALILAVLDRESALGKNVGRCTYQKAMHPTRDIPAFLEIMSELNLDPESMMVSCANSDGAYGGALGPAQFIPSTWKLYKDQIAKVTGNNPPSPWNNADAFTATSLYLKDALGQCTSYSANKTSQERCAAARYYAGGNWKRHLWTYGEATIARANSFREDIETING